ncbi:putative late blight resistance protein homolog R1B-17 [Andrographis paniculata]|uniref:putative late blight resistance protein homolog R1B-17 n=1 Tax=Andrographis paniculata TaxID=175694 RepID=UPI0021E91803|nr:putative late blight resistance protein homolog R1B-17 [Andrographis paniculata]
MAVAAYTSLVSLTHVLDNVLYRARICFLHVEIKQIESLQEGVNFLIELLELHPVRECQKIESLWRQISKACFEAEEIFDLHVVCQLQKGSWRENPDMDLTGFREDLGLMIEKIDYFKRDLSMIKGLVDEVRVGKQTRASIPTIGYSSNVSSNVKNIIVGLDEDVIKIKYELARDEANLQIIPIVGMGGIGKTTLAKRVYEDKYVVEHFDVRIWLTVSQKYRVDEILLGLVNYGKVVICRENLERCGEALHKKLFGRRYLIVMDDLWTLQAWDEFRRFFPDNGNGSRIIMTTRMSNMAASLGSHQPYLMRFLDEKKSWSLFCRIVFGEENCPHLELSQIGRVIVRNCKGLPLEITVIGGLLANAGSRKDYWESVAKNVSSFGNASDGEHCLKILLLSYNNLPLYLKPCFLYMRVFREDAKIDVLKLIRLWVDGGFIKAREGQTLEELAERYLKELVDRNLVFMREQGLIEEEIKTCGIHDLLRDLCLSESNKERFMHFPRLQDIHINYGERLCFLCGSFVYDEDRSNPFELVFVSSSTSQGYPHVCGACKATYSGIKILRLVKVMDEDGCSCDSLVQHTKLRSVSATMFYCPKFISPSNLRLLWNLQTLLFPETKSSAAIVLPFEIWEMPQLRTIYAESLVMPKPPDANVEEKEIFILKNLHSLSVALNLELTDEILRGIPNLKQLEIEHNECMRMSNGSLCDLTKLSKLKSLHVIGAYWKSYIFPNSLKLLKLKKCTIPWSRMSMVSSLPNLEHLELNDTAKGSDWNPTEGEFLRLKVLIIVRSDLVQWIADEYHYPVLEVLELIELPSLEEIPWGIGDIPTLHKISLKKCSESSINSAYQIWEEQQSMENHTLKINVFMYGENFQSMSSWKMMMMMIVISKVQFWEIRNQV